MAVKRIEDQKVTNEITKKIDPFAEPVMVTKDDILGIAVPKKSDAMFARYTMTQAEDLETGLKFNIAITKTRK